MGICGGTFDEDNVDSFSMDGIGAGGVRFVGGGDSSPGVDLGHWRVASGNR